MKDTDIDQATRRPLAAATWERAKGELRALIGIQGSYPSNYQHSPDWEELSDKVEEFIRYVEDMGLHE